MLPGTEVLYKEVLNEWVSLQETPIFPCKVELDVPAVNKDVQVSSKHFWDILQMFLEFIVIYCLNCFPQL